jgi:hypothetical protein
MTPIEPHSQFCVKIRNNGGRKCWHVTRVSLRRARS